MFYADKPSAPREFPDGLERELGGPRALLVGAQNLPPSATPPNQADLSGKARKPGEEL